jgi:hypothetical protein
MVEEEFILKALDDLEMSYETENVYVTRGGARRKVDILIKRTLGADIALVKGRDSYNILADWWSVLKLNRKDFINRIQKRYAYHATRAKLAEQGFDLVKEEVDQDGKIHLLLRRAV